MAFWRTQRRRARGVGHRGEHFASESRRGSATRGLAEIGVDPARGLIVNGDVPVKIEAGESPIQRGGRSTTIDGAFSEACGERGVASVRE